MQYDDDDDDLSFEEDAGSPLELGRSLRGGQSTSFAAALGGRGGFSSSSYRDQDYGGGGGDAYDFPLDFGKASPYASGFNFDPKSGGAAASSARAASKPAAKTGALAKAGIIAASAKPAAATAKAAKTAPATKAGAGLKPTSFDSRFDTSRFERSGASAGAKPKGDDDFRRFLDEDSDEDEGSKAAPKAAPKSAAAKTAPAPKAAVRTPSDTDGSGSISPPESPQQVVPKKTAAAPAKATSSRPAAPESASEVSSDHSDEPPPPAAPAKAAPAAKATVPAAAAETRPAAVSKAPAVAAGPPAPTRARSASPSQSAATPSQGSRSSSGRGRSRDRASSPRSRSHSRSASRSRSKSRSPLRSRSATPRSRSRSASPRSARSPESVKSAGSSPANPLGKIMYASDLFASSPVKSPVIKEQEPPPRPVALAPAAAKAAAKAPSEDSALSPRQRTYSDDFIGEGGPGAQRANTSYTEDFEASESQEPSARPTPAATVASVVRQATSVSTTPAVPKAQVTPVPVAFSTSSTAVAAAAPSLLAGQVSVTQGPRVAPLVEDPDYRPRRPTCHVGVQANVPVETGIQCDLLPTPVDDATYGIPPQAAGYWPGYPPVQGAPPGYPFMPYGAPGMMPMPMGPPQYPFWAYGASPQMPGAAPFPPQPPTGLLRGLFGAALLGQRPPPKEAWGAAPAAAAEAGSQSRGSPEQRRSGAGAPPHPAVVALGLVDESFKEQIDLLRQAAARHRSLLERSRFTEGSLRQPSAAAAACEVAVG